MRIGILAETTLMKTLQEQLGLPLLDLNQESADEQALAVQRGEVLRVGVGVLQRRQELQAQLQRGAVAAVAYPL